MARKVKTVLTAQQVLDTIDRSVEEWVAKQGSEAAIETKVCNQLDGALNKIMMVALGMRTGSFHDSHYEVDSRSPGYQFFEARVKELVQAWLGENLSVINADVGETVKNAMKKHYRGEYESRIKRALIAAASKKAEADAIIITEQTWLSTDKIKAAIGDLITEENAHAAKAEAARGKEFQERTKLSSVEVLGVVAFDGINMSDLIQEPGACCWHTVILHTVFGNNAAVLTNGDEWHPIDLVHNHDGIDVDRTKVLEHFRHSNQVIFNYLDNMDRIFIKTAIADHYRSNEPEVPF